MPSNDEQRASSPDVLSARHDVEVAKLELESRLRDVQESGEKALAKVARKARPVLLGVAIVVGALVVVRVVRSASRKRRRTLGRRRESPGQPSLLKVALGAALRAAVRMLATRVAEQAVLRLASANESNESESPDSAELESAVSEFTAESQRGR